MSNCVTQRGLHKYRFVGRSPDIMDRLPPGLATGFEVVWFVCTRCGGTTSKRRKYANPALPGTQWEDVFGGNK